MSASVSLARRLRWLRDVVQDQTHIRVIRIEPRLGGPGTDGVLMLVEFEMKTGRSFMTRESIKSAVTEHVPAENWEGAYNVVPVPVVELRRQLLVMTGSGGKGDPAARCLNLIDKFRDEYGAPESEPRHPDLASGRPWPILTPDPHAETGN